MKAPKQNCPRCNSEQSFRPLREQGDREGTITIFIRCTMCRWSRELRQSTSELEKLRKDELRLMEVARTQHERLGTANGATRRLLENTRAAMRREREGAGL